MSSYNPKKATVYRISVPKGNTESPVIINAIVSMYGHPPKRGDIIQINGHGEYFWNGEKAILSGRPITFIPSEFKIPKEFSIDYWDDCLVHFNDSEIGDFCYDTSEIKKPPTKREEISILIEWIPNDLVNIIFEYIDTSLKEVFCCRSSVSIFKDISTDFYIFLEHDEKEKEKSLERFFETGRCYKLRNEFLSYYGEIEDLQCRCVYVDEYKNRMRVEE